MWAGKAKEEAKRCTQCAIMIVPVKEYYQTKGSDAKGRIENGRLGCANKRQLANCQLPAIEKIEKGKMDYLAPPPENPPLNNKFDNSITPLVPNLSPVLPSGYLEILLSIDWVKRKSAEANHHSEEALFRQYASVLYLALARLLLYSIIFLPSSRRYLVTCLLHTLPVLPYLTVTFGFFFSF